MIVREWGTSLPEGEQESRNKLFSCSRNNIRIFCGENHENIRKVGD